jgi:2'-5' RNA ligase
MKYMIVHLIKGEPAYFHKNLSSELANVFTMEQVSHRIPPHLTLKAPFDARNVSDIQKTLARFATTHASADVTMDGFGHFDRRVIYIDIKPSVEAEKLITELTAELRKIPWLSFDAKENKDHKRLHATLAYADTRKIFDELAKYLKDEKAQFQFKLDNVAILEREKEKWSIHSEYTLQS